MRRLLSEHSTGRMSGAGIALLRIVTGSLIATVHGWHKVVEGWQYLTTGSDWPLLHDTIQLGFPLPGVFAVLAAISQFFGGWLMALGAWTRGAALLVAFTMLTALVFNLQSGGPDAQLAGMYGLVTGAFVLAGGGRWSIDRHLQEVASPVQGRPRPLLTTADSPCASVCVNARCSTPLSTPLGERERLLRGGVGPERHSK